MLRGVISVLGVALIAVSLAGFSTAAPCADADMTVTATFPNDVGFEGLYKYTISGSWDTGVSNGLSHISFLYELECPCICDTTEAGSFFAQFPTPAGTATGEDSLGNACDVDFIGLHECQGDPTLPSNSPAIKFELPEGQGCETTNTGTGTWCFYSPLPPLPVDTYVDAVMIKYGGNFCSGDLTGELPNCSSCAPVPTERATWGRIKVILSSEEEPQ